MPVILTVVRILKGFTMVVEEMLLAVVLLVVILPTRVPFCSVLIKFYNGVHKNDIHDDERKDDDDSLNHIGPRQCLGIPHPPIVSYPEIRPQHCSVLDTVQDIVENTVEITVQNTIQILPAYRQNSKLPHF